MNVMLNCGCTIDDETTSTVHEDDGLHYPIGLGPNAYCKRCDQFRQGCLCNMPATQNVGYNASSPLEMYPPVTLGGTLVTRTEAVEDDGKVYTTLEVGIDGYAKDTAAGSCRGGGSTMGVAVFKMEGFFALEGFRPNRRVRIKLEEVPD